MLQVSPGFVFLTGKADDQRPVPVLPETACSQSLILSGYLLCLGADCDVSAAVRGIEIRVCIVLMSGFFPVAVGGCFPISDVYFIMEDDIPWWLSFSCSRVCTV